jgi:hypothetical protein
VELTGGGGSSSSFGDVNGDGNLDILVTGWNANANETAVLYLGLGNGDFLEQDAGLIGVRYSTNLIGDVNGDGNLDILITGLTAYDRPTATLYLGDGSGGFTEHDAGLKGTFFGSVSFGDVDNNGTLDVILTGEEPRFEPTARLYLGDGSGGFTQADAGITGVTRSSSTLGDVNGDGNLDLLITGQATNHRETATLYLGDGSGGFTPQDVGLTGVENGSASFGDVNGDGDLDLVITGADAYNDPTATLYFGDGTGNFTDQDAGLTRVDFSSSSFGDVNGDGILDLIITGDASVFPDVAPFATSSYLGDGRGGFTQQNEDLTPIAADLPRSGTLTTTGISIFSLQARTDMYQRRRCTKTSRRGTSALPLQAKA